MVTARQKRQKKREKGLDVALAKGERKAGTKERVTEKEAFKPSTRAKKTIQLGEFNVGDKATQEQLEKIKKKKKLTKTLTKTAAILGGTAAVLTGVGAATGAFAGAGSVAAGAGSRAVITRTATTFGRFGKSVTAQRGFVGRPAVSKVSKIFTGKKAGLQRFASNPKSSALTKGFLLKLGMGLAVASFAKDIIGTYPFAAFLKEEALQATGFPISKAIQAGNFEDAQRLLDVSNELINHEESIVNKLPYKNVQNAVNNYMKAQAEANIVWQNLIVSEGEKNVALAAGEDEFSVRLKENKIAKQKEDIRKSEVFALRREGKFDEADELEAEILKELEGGQ